MLVFNVRAYNARGTQQVLVVLIPGRGVPAFTLSNIRNFTL